MEQNITNQSVITTLTELGLGQNEAILYEILLKNPDANIPLLRKNSQFTRTMLYYVLNNLISLELAKSSKIGKKTAYNAAPPEKLEDFVHNQEKELERQKSLLKGVISELGSTYRLAHNKPGIRFFEGPAGIKEILDDSLTSKTIIYTYADIEAIVKHIDAINKNYVAKRDKLGIKKRAILTDSPFARNYLKDYYRDVTDIKFIKGDFVPFSNVMQIYDNKISYLTLEEDKIIGVIIQDDIIYRMHKALFEFTWAKLPATTPNQTASI